MERVRAAARPPVGRADVEEPALTTAALVLAAGSGVRLGPGRPKALRPAGGVPLLVHAVRAIAGCAAVTQVLLLAPPGETATVRDLLDEAGLTRVRVVEGGATRQESVRRGLAALADDVDVDAVLVHDAARPFVPVAVVDAVAGALRGPVAAVVPAVPVTDTVKEVEPAEGLDAERVVATPDRVRLRAVQTPQAFRRSLLAEVHARALAEGFTATDDAALVEHYGGVVLVVPGHAESFKVTGPLDLDLAEALLARGVSA